MKTNELIGILEEQLRFIKMTVTEREYLENTINKLKETINYARSCESDNEQLKTYDIHQCINEIGIEANKCDGLFYDISKNKSFRYNIKKAIDKMLYKK